MMSKAAAHPWASKKDIAFFRGSRTSDDREEIMKFAKVSRSYGYFLIMKSHMARFTLLSLCTLFPFCTCFFFGTLALPALWFSVFLPVRFYCAG